MLMLILYKMKFKYANQELKFKITNQKYLIIMLLNHMKQALKLLEIIIKL